MKKRIVILYSGGLDSFLMAKLAKHSHLNDLVKPEDREVIKVYIKINQPNMEKELAVLPPDVEVLDMTWFDAKTSGKDETSSGNIFIPGRNWLFSTVVACKYLPDEIWLGALKGEDHAGSTDKNEVFRNLFNAGSAYVLSPFKENVKLRYPFIDMNWSKLHLTAWGVACGWGEEIVNSRSCLSGEGHNCGKCVVCARRSGIFPQLGLSEKYDTDPWTVKDNLMMALNMLHHFKFETAHTYTYGTGHYDKYRVDEIIPSLGLNLGIDNQVRECYTRDYIERCMEEVSQRLAIMGTGILPHNKE